MKKTSPQVGLERWVGRHQGRNFKDEHTEETVGWSSGSLGTPLNRKGVMVFRTIVGSILYAWSKTKPLNSTSTGNPWFFKGRVSWFKVCFRKINLTAITLWNSGMFFYTPNSPAKWLSGYVSELIKRKPPLKTSLSKGRDSHPKMFFERDPEITCHFPAG